MTLPALTIDEIMRRAPVIPVLIIEDAAHAVPLGRALVAGGLPVLEITLRTPVAMACIERMVGEIEGAVVGAGTVLTPSARQACADIGARFCVSPGLIEGELDEGPVPLLPGIATATELMAGLAAGFTRFAVPVISLAASTRPEAFASPPAGEVLLPAGSMPRTPPTTSGAAQRRLCRRQLGRPARCHPPATGATSPSAGARSAALARPGPRRSVGSGRTLRLVGRLSDRRGDRLDQQG